MKSIIREACTLYCDVLAGLMGQLGYPTTQAVILEQINFYQNNHAYKSWVAEYDGVVVGCISVALVEYFHRNAHFMRITSLIVDTNYRRQGIGKSLIEYAELYAYNNKCVFIELTSGAHRAELGSHDFYTSLGYQDLFGIKKYMAKKLVKTCTDRT